MAKEKEVAEEVVTEENTMKAEIAAKIAKYEKEVEAYKLVGQIETAVAIEAEIKGLKQEILRH
jgi:hypothetical protein